MVCLIEELRHTAVARWHQDVLGDLKASAAVDPGSAGCRTRLRYYQALLSCLEASNGEAGLAAAELRDRELRDAVAMAAGAGSASTLYTLAGPSAPTALLSHVEASLSSDPGTRRDVVARLAAEVKVWSHWPYRCRWITELAQADRHCRQAATATLVRDLVAWARENRTLAVSFGRDPPLSAVEDLVILAAGQASTGQARSLLAEVVGIAAEPLGAAPDAVVAAVAPELAVLGLAGSPTFSELADQLTESMSALRQMWPQLPADQRTAVQATLGSDFVDLVELVGAG